MHLAKKGLGFGSKSNQYISNNDESKERKAIMARYGNDSTENKYTK